MELYVKPILIFLCVSIVGSHASLTGSQQANDETTVDDSSLKKIHVIPHRKMVEYPTGIFDDKNKSKDHAHIKVGPGGVEVTHGKVYVKVHPGINPFQYEYTGNKTKDGRSLFFLQKDMKPGHQMTMNFTESTNAANFLPREMARSIPFSSNKMPKILREFSMQPGSQEAQIIEETIKGCERKGISGEQKYCATCLEDMIDYAKSSLGKNVKILSTEAKEGYNKGQRYTIGNVIKATRGDDSMVCHKLNYAYAVYYCHKTKGTFPHIVSLNGEKGTKANVVAICHKDTSAWNPRHLAFQVLNVRPGSLPICHFLPKDHLVWVRA